MYPLVDSGSIQKLLHQNLMRLRKYISEPNEPLPDLCKDWQPPSPSYRMFVGREREEAKARQTGGISSEEEIIDQVSIRRIPHVSFGMLGHCIHHGGKIPKLWYLSRAPPVNDHFQSRAPWRSCPRRRKLPLTSTPPPFPSKIPYDDPMSFSYQAPLLVRSQARICGCSFKSVNSGVGCFLGQHGHHCVQHTVMRWRLSAIEPGSQCGLM